MKLISPENLRSILTCDVNKDQIFSKLLFDKKIRFAFILSKNLKKFNLLKLKLILPKEKFVLFEIESFFKRFFDKSNFIIQSTLFNSD